MVLWLPITSCRALKLDCIYSIKEGRVEKKNIEINVEKCAGCLHCQLLCSFTYTGAFNPEKARIVIEFPTGSSWRGKIGFTEDCIDGCSLCARNCNFGAIVVRQQS